MFSQAASRAVFISVESLIAPRTLPSSVFPLPPADVMLNQTLHVPAGQNFTPPTLGPHSFLPCFPFLVMPSCFPCSLLLQPCSTHPLRNPEAPSESRSRNHVYALPEFSCPSSVSPQVLNTNENSDLLEQLSREVATYQLPRGTVEWKPTGTKN